MIVDCPKWLQRRMFRNLKKASRDNITPARADLADKILRAIEKKAAKAKSNVAAGRAKVKAAVSDCKRAKSMSQGTTTRVRNHAEVAGRRAGNVMLTTIRRKNPTRLHKLGVNK